MRSSAALVQETAAVSATRRYAMMFAKTVAAGAAVLREFDVLPDPHGPRARAASGESNSSPASRSPSRAARASGCGPA